jgi:hypothetical protein
MSCSVLNPLMSVVGGDCAALIELPDVYKEPDKEMDE